MQTSTPKTLQNRRAVVAGSDPAGLAAAISLANRGARVIVLESGPQYCPALIPRAAEGYRFDPWPPAITHPRILAELFAGAGLRLTDFVTLRQFEPALRIILPDDSVVDIRASEEATLEGLPEAIDRDAFQSLLRAAGSEARLRGDTRQNRESLLNRVLTRLPRSLPKRTAWEADPQTAAIASSLRILSGGSARNGRLAALGDLQAGGCWTVDGGYDALRRALLRLCQILNIKFSREARLEEIELQSGRVRRVRGQGFQELTTSILVLNAGSPHDLSGLLPPSDETEKWLHRYRRHREAPQALELEISALKSWHGAAPLTMICSPEPAAERIAADRWRLPPSAPTIAVTAHSIIHRDAAPQGAAALTIRAEAPRTGARYRWSEEQLAEAEKRLLTAAENAGFEGLAAAAETIALHGPDNPSPGIEWGAGFAWDTGSLRRLRALPAASFPIIPGLYLAGPGVFPGAGLGSLAASGIRAAAAAARDAGGE